MQKEQSPSQFSMQERIEFLAATELFSGLDKSILQNIAAELVPRQIVLAVGIDHRGLIAQALQLDLAQLVLRDVAGGKARAADAHGLGVAGVGLAGQLARLLLTHNSGKDVPRNGVPAMVWSLLWSGCTRGGDSVTSPVGLPGPAGYSAATSRRQRAVELLAPSVTSKKMLPSG